MVTSGLVLAAISLVLPWPRTVDVLRALWRWCPTRGYGLVGHVAGVVVIGLALLAAASAARHRHREALALVGTQSPEFGVALLDQAGPVALAVARQQITRLVKIRADQVAGVRHPPIDLARALVAMATGSAAPSEVLAACLPL